MSVCQCYILHQHFFLHFCFAYFFFFVMNSTLLYRVSTILVEREIQTKKLHTPSPSSRNLFIYISHSNAHVHTHSGKETQSHEEKNEKKRRKIIINKKIKSTEKLLLKLRLHVSPVFSLFLLTYHFSKVYNENYQTTRYTADVRLIHTD